jgi:hypothetical protein
MCIFRSDDYTLLYEYESNISVDETSLQFSALYEEELCHMYIQTAQY